MSENLAGKNTGEPRRSSRIKQKSSTPVSTPGKTPQGSFRDDTPVQTVQKSTEKDFGTTPQGSVRDMTPVQTVQKSIEKDSEDESSEGRGSQQKRKRNVADQPDPLEESWRPLTDEDRKNWKGWVELESDPELFNFLLQEYGVQCVKIQEVIGLDDESMATIPKPLGLVFLFRYSSIDAQEDPDADECPKHVWFANQTTENACATIALMNIVMNIPEIELGPQLAAFKNATKPLDPAHRGQQLGDNAFIRGIHNSFLRRSDILAADLSLKYEFQAWNRRPKSRKTVKSGRKKRVVREDSQDSQDSRAYHFVAYVPVRGEVWKLDGLQHDPTCIGRAGNDWVSVARSNILMRMKQHEKRGDIDYNLLALTKCPLGLVLERISQNLHSLTQVEEALEEQVTEWKLYIDSDHAIDPVKKLQQSFGLSSEDIAMAELEPFDEGQLQKALSNPEALISLYKSLAQDHKDLYAKYMGELGNVSEEREKALARQRDDTPLVAQAIKTLADSGVLKDLVAAVSN